MKHTSKYIFSFCLMLSLFTVQAQETTTNKTAITNKTEVKAEKTAPKKVATEVKQDSIPAKTDRYGVRFGVDLYKLTRGLYDSDYKGVEFTGDYRLTKKYYLAAEIGTENKTTDDDRLNSTAKGSYLKVGFDYNMYENWLDMENIISVGLRYGFSTFSQELNNYKIYNSDPYWGELPPTASGEKFSGLSASWLEVNAGVKAKVFNNIFVGFSVQLKTLVSNKKPDNFDNLYIPGFNRTYNGNFGIGFNYTVSYFIPIYKKKVVIPGTETKK
ncbi:DUF6048 family protein [Flavobacterium sp. EDS]|uniref:DUF6048 family protein n=1 Tax=Flavobacterium sp. EDS TaxID=2897328 RepID=UPI001E2BBD5B|nr:DUF6048 family protein [Flavobacterium sp. EDS]MCD0474844.1 DUF6048 family protein [Flavobacterium sp. EDS]